MPNPLEKKFAAFLKERRGEQPRAAFSGKLGMSESTLFRLEQGEQSATLRLIYEVTKRLKCTLRDVFGDDC